MQLSTYQKWRMVKGIPKKQKYMRQCLQEFWKLGLKPRYHPDREWKGIEGESPWHGHRLQLKTNYHFMQYCKHTLDVSIMSDFMNRDTNKLFTETEWRGMIDEIHFKNKTNSFTT